MWLDQLIATQSELHNRILRRVRNSMADSTMDQLSRVNREAADDTIYELDHAAETGLIEDIQQLFSPFCNIHLVCEGSETTFVPSLGLGRDLPHYSLILDPVDGTRGLIYNKRSAWVLSAMAPYSETTSLSMADLTVAVQTEIPTMRSNLSDQLAGIRNIGVVARTCNLETDEITVWQPTPSRAPTLYGGFSTICRFFPPGRDRLAALDDALLHEILGPPKGRAPVFEDQYLSSGGLLYQLSTGKDRFVADLRGVLNSYRRDANLDGVLTCHPYDVCTALIAEELGVVITDHLGAPLSFALDTETEVSWCGYANTSIQLEVEETLHRLIPTYLVYRHNSVD